MNDMIGCGSHDPNPSLLFHSKSPWGTHRRPLQAATVKTHLQTEPISVGTERRMFSVADPTRASCGW